MSFAETKSGQIVLKSKHLARKAADPGLDFMLSTYRLWRTHPYIGTVVFLLNLWCWSLLFHHLAELKTMAETGQSIVKILFPF